MSSISELTREQLADALFNCKVPIPMEPLVSAFLYKLARAPVYGNISVPAARLYEITQVMTVRVSSFTHEEMERMRQWVAEETL